MSLAPLAQGTWMGGTPQTGARYVVHRVLGQGGFGITYLCGDAVARTNVVIKECAIDALCVRNPTTTGIEAKSETAAARFARAMRRFIGEADALFTLSNRESANPHIVQVRDRWIERGTAYYAMDVIEAAREWPATWPDAAADSLQVERVLRYGRQLLSALHSVHESGIGCHGDIKPQNVLIDHHDKVCLIDFGAIRTDAELARTIHSVMYTRGWAPIELQSPGALPIGAHSDLYSWAMLMWGAIIGHPERVIDDKSNREIPWPTEPTVRVLQQAKGAGANPYADARARLAASGVPDSYAAAIAACIEVMPTDRPQSAAEVLAQIDGEADSAVWSEIGTSGATAIAARAGSGAMVSPEDILRLRSAAASNSLIAAAGLLGAALTAVFSGTIDAAVGASSLGWGTMALACVLWLTYGPGVLFAWKTSKRDRIDPTRTAGEAPEIVWLWVVVLCLAAYATWVALAIRALDDDLGMVVLFALVVAAVAGSRSLSKLKRLRG